VRVACLDVPALPLQLLWRRQPTWRAHPVVVVDEDRPQGEVLWACERARRRKILPGQRYGHALSLAGDLRAGVVTAAEVTAAIDELAADLRRCSPRVEPARDQPGTCWLDGEGLRNIYPDGDAWVRDLANILARRALIGAVVVGFTRFGTYAIARAQRKGTLVFACDADERAAARMVPLDRLDVAPKLRDALARLGVTTLGELVRLPGGGILERFGSDAHRLYQLAAGERWDPLVPEPPPDAPDERVVLDDPEDDVERLLFSIKAATDRLLSRLAARRRAVVALWLEMTLRRYNATERFERRAECLRPAEATLDPRVLMRLCHLRLAEQREADGVGALPASPVGRGRSPLGIAGSPPTAGVIELRVWAEDVPATREQLALFAERPRRDLRAAAEAVARLRAELGDDAVVKAVLREGHLPEARFGWEPISTVPSPRPRPSPIRLLIRRVMTRPLALPPQSPNVRDDGWVLAGLAQGTVTRIVGPHVISGGWWSGAEIHREYHFVETRRGDCLWLYYDRRRRRWFQHGVVE